MIKLIFYILMLLIIINIDLYSQNTSDISKDEVIRKLNSKDEFDRMAGLMYARKYKIIEAIPIIEKDIFKQDFDLQESYIFALESLESPNLKAILHAYIDSADFHYDETWTPLRMKAFATQELFRYGDYSTVKYAVENLEKDTTRNSWNSVYLANEIIRYCPQYKQRVKVALCFQLKNNSASDNRYSCMMDLISNFGKEILPNILETFVSDSDPVNRSISLDYLCDWNYISLDSLIKERVYREPLATYRNGMLYKMLTKHPTPANFDFIKNYVVNEKDDLIKGLIGYNLSSFIPPKPDSTLTVLDQLNGLKTLTGDVFRKNWIDEVTNSELNNFLDISKTFLQRQDLVNCAKEIRFFQNEVTYEYNDLNNSTQQFITKDAFKFLYYNAGYILNRLPLVPQIFNLNINITSNGTVEKSPSQTEYDSSSTVTLTARPSSGYIFKEWTGDATGTNATISVVMNSNKNITAVFVPAPSGATVKLINSSGALLTGGTLQYYEGSWKDAINNNNGTFTVNTTRPTISLRMTYEYVSTDKQQDLSTNNTVSFSTVLCTIRVKDAQSQLVNNAQVSYYSGAWRLIGSTVNGIVTKELMPAELSFRAKLGTNQKDIKQNIADNNIVEISLP